MRSRSKRNRSEGARELVSYLQPHSSEAEAYRTLSVNIQFAGINKEIKVLMVTSSVQGEGKSTTSANLAVVSAQAGKKVLLIDCDLRKPSVHQTFHTSNRTGLTSLLINQADFSEAVQHSEHTGVNLLTSGPTPPNPAELLGSQKMQSLLQQIRGLYDLIIIDTPPVLAVPDSLMLSPVVDGVLLVLGSRIVARDHVKSAKAMLDQVQAHVVGAVMNNKRRFADSN